jgi:hypothetical protein
MMPGASMADYNPPYELFTGLMPSGINGGLRYRESALRVQRVGRD